MPQRVAPRLACALTVTIAALSTLAVTASPAHAIDTSFGSFGNAAPQFPIANVNAAAVGAASRAGGGLWVAAADGGIFTSGGAPFLGSAGAFPLNQPVVGVAGTPSGNGYWMVAGDGGVFSYGDAHFFGSLGATRLNQPIVAMTSTITGNGYWMVGADGGMFSFGDATFYGSLPGLNLPAGSVGPAIDVVARPQGDGYWVVTADGGVYGFGAASFVNPPRGRAAVPSGRIVGAAATPSGGGLWLVSNTGGVYTTGDAPFYGAPGVVPGQRTVDIAPTPGAGGYWTISTSGLNSANPGDRGPTVTALQERLSGLGYWLGTTDGVYGSLMSQAVMAFQKVNSLPRTGVADPVTVDRLSRAGKPQARSTSGDLIEVDLARQVLFVVRGGQVQTTLNVSTGSGKPFREVLPDGRVATGDAITHTGRFRIGRELPDGWRQSDLGLLWRPKYFDGGIAIHGAGSVPAYPASHGCVRVTTSAMDWLYSSGVAPIGTTVWVY